MRLIASTLADAKSSKPWPERVLLGCWTVSVKTRFFQCLLLIFSQVAFLPLCQEYLPSYPIAHIGFNIPYARQFLKEPGVSFNMLQKLMVGPLGDKFLQDTKAENRSMFLWTVNEVTWMKWCIEKEVDGVITDDPKKYLEVCKAYNGEKIHISIGQWMGIISTYILAAIFGTLFRHRYKFRGDLKKVVLS